MSTSTEALAARVNERLSARITSCVVSTRQVIVELPARNLLDVCRTLRDESEFAFEQLMDLCGVDYLAYGQADWTAEGATESGFSRAVGPRSVREQEPEMARFAVAYQLLSVRNNQRLRLRTFAEGEPPTLPSVVEVWASANWFEREAFDLFGILFDGHPDLRRILTDYGFVGHPFRKDFPLEGEVEVRYDPEKGRVVYQPVTIENRVLVPRVIRHDKRYLRDSEGEPSNA